MITTSPFGQNAMPTQAQVYAFVSALINEVRVLRQDFAVSAIHPREVVSHNVWEELRNQFRGTFLQIGRLFREQLESSGMGSHRTDRDGSAVYDLV